ncbi:MAG: methyltransferase domain-containing protein [Alphaproteobacteria bacterium]|nr:methyltransferase domain-containing protein [Alphaproteobacteria bacterium]
MFFYAPDYQKFYDSEIGGIVRRTLCGHIEDLWPDVHGLRVMGCGYTIPYLDVISKNTERTFNMMPTRQGAENWVLNEKNLTLLCDDRHMPIENSSVDRILLIHYLENADNIKKTLKEVWRILKPNGRIMVIVPNRMGAWTHADWSPFGQGRPFTTMQICESLRDNMFIQECHKMALFVPPIPDSPVMMRSANLIEKMGGRIIPFVAGVHILEASKQIYAKVDNGGTGSAVLAKTREILAGQGKAVPQSYTKHNKGL